MVTARIVNKNIGLSIVEAVLALVIVAAIATTAMPKFSSTQIHEDISVVTTAGEFDNAVRLARAQWFANGQSGVSRIEGYADGKVWSSDRGWPISYRTSAPPVTINASHCANIWNGIMQSSDSPRASVEGDAGWQAQRGERTDTCLYTANRGSAKHVISYSTKSGKVSYR